MTDTEVEQELFVCDGCDQVVRDPVVAPTDCVCGGAIRRYVRP